jgi:hypothetical protein
MRSSGGLRAFLVSGFLIASLMISMPRAVSLDVPPEVVSTSPNSGESNVSVFTNISVIFSKAMNTTSGEWNITPFVPLVSSWWNDTTLNLTQTTPMTPATTYSIWMTANNTAGTPVRRGGYTWQFTTTCGGTCIVGASPVEGARNVLLTANIVVKFSDPANLTALTFDLAPSVGTLSYAWGPGNMMVTIGHSSPFSLCTAYVVTIGGVVPGPVPNPWSFTTACPGATFVDVAATKGFSGVDGSLFAWGDYNRDGYEDILINGNRLYRNNGPPNYDFTDVSSGAGIANSTANTGIWGDYNNDGWLDFYAPAGGIPGPTSPWDTLWRNNGDGTFTNVTAAAGNVKDLYPSVAAGWGDYDRDGFIDLYVANAETTGPNGFPDKLWHNRGDGTFVDNTTGSAITDSGPSKVGRSVDWGDYNNDGWLDLYVSNYRIAANYLWKNLGNGKFTDAAADTNTTGWYQTDNLCYDYYGGGSFGKQYGHTIGSAWADFNNDGNLDIFTANLAHKYVGNISGSPYDIRGYITDDSRFFRNNGPPSYDFTDIREAAGIPLKPIWTRDWNMVESPLSPCITAGPVAGVVGDELFGNVMWTDYDLDGWQDMYITQVYGTIDYSYSYLYHNNHDGTFSDVAVAAKTRVWGAEYADAWADFNNDGWPDLITHGQYPSFGGASRIRLFQNQGTSNSWLKVKLNGCTSNAAAIGARILATANGMTQMRNVEAGSGSHSAMNSLVQEFGFGDYRGTVDLAIRWPNNNTQTINGVALNQTLHILEPGPKCQLPERVPYVTADLSSGSGSDVVLNWQKAQGDDPWTQNVTGYAVCYGTSYDPTAASYQYLGDVPAGSQGYTHVGGGIGDANTYYYAIQTNGTAGVIRSIAQAVKFVKQLVPGEQLLSIPVPLADSSLGNVLRGVTYNHIRTYEPGLPDPWQSYAPSRQYNDFDRFTPFQAFWIGITSSSLLTVAGPIEPSTIMQLKSGWNFVGFPSTLPHAVADAVAGLGSNFRAIEGYDASAGPYYLGRLGPSDILSGGSGYWIYVDSAANWVVPFMP